MTVRGQCLKAPSPVLSVSAEAHVRASTARLHTAHQSRALMRRGGAVWLTGSPSVRPPQVERLLAVADLGPRDEKEDSVQEDVGYVGM